MRFIFITCLAVVSVVHGLTSSTIDGMLPRPTFLKDVSSTDSWLFNEFQNNPHLTRDEVDFVLEVWAEAQSDSVQSAFNAWSANVSSATKELIAESDAAVANLSNDAQLLYSDLKPVFTNNRLTEIDRCTQLMTIQSNSADFTVKELLEAVPMATGGCNQNGLAKHPRRVRRLATGVRLAALVARLIIAAERERRRNRRG
uniref:ANIS5_cation-bd domain-containing protein n=1 Tax=Panagrellus redivivus TaxID=6233 RepID=A0A7E4ZQG3_PANRE